MRYFTIQTESKTLAERVANYLMDNGIYYTVADMGIYTDVVFYGDNETRDGVAEFVHGYALA